MRKCRGNGEEMERDSLSTFPHFLSISLFSLHFLFIFSFSLHFFAARLPGCHNLCNPGKIQKRWANSKAMINFKGIVTVSGTMRIMTSATTTTTTTTMLMVIMMLMLMMMTMMMKRWAWAEGHSSILEPDPKPAHGTCHGRYQLH